MFPLPALEWPSGHAEVHTGAFSFEADLAAWPSGAGTAGRVVQLRLGTAQPSRVTDLVGEDCEHLGGGQVYVDSPGDPKQLVMQLGFTVP